MKKFVTYGYQGTGNIGDDLMFLSFLVRNEGNNIYSIKREYCVRNEIHIGRLKYLWELFFGDNVLVFTGGNIFNIASRKSYLKLVFFWLIFIIRHFRELETRIISAGLNMKTPSWVTKIYYVSILDYIDIFETRDSITYAFLNSIDAKCIVTMQHDAVLKDIEKIRSELSIEHIPCDAKRCVIFLSSQNMLKRPNINWFTRNALLYDECILFCQTNDDEVFAQNLVDKKSARNMKIWRYSAINLKLFLETLLQSDMVFTERYHGAVLAEALQVSWLPLGESEKLNNFKKSLERV